jgi:hypothetical protein
MTATDDILGVIVALLVELFGTLMSVVSSRSSSLWEGTG